MADRGDTHYHVRGLNRWFAVSSFLLLVTAFWMVIDDWARPWKQYQREFRRIEIEQAREDLEQPDAVAAMEAEARLLEQIEETRDLLESQNVELEEAEQELREIENEQFMATEAEKKAKQNYNFDRWRVEEHRIHYGEDEAYAEMLARLNELEDEHAARVGEKQVADDAVLVQQALIDALRAEVLDLEADAKEAGKSVDLVRKKLEALDPEDGAGKLANLVRDFPGLDFIGPNLKVQKVIPSDLTFELNFLKKRRVDMCQTCHVAADRTGFEDEEQPFQSHPRQDLFLSAKSPHPLGEVGCTICHRGSGEALDFVRADHRPTDAEEGERWHEEYGWHKKHYWDYPMLSSEYIEASCVQCHKDSMELIAEDAPKVTEGYRLFERYGCYACHKVEWFPTDRRPGPTLAKIEQKTNAEFIASWIADPKGFRPTTWMPQIFHLENYSPETEVVTSEYGQGRPMMGDEWSDAAVAAVAAFITSVSEEEPMPPIPVAGDAVRGEETFRLVGCYACHNVAPFPGETPAEFEDDEEFDGQIFDKAKLRRETNEHGPELRGIATKVTPEWLYAWIKDPHSYWSETRMPDLRLTDQEAADIVAYVFEDPEGIFNDVPEGWEPGDQPYQRDVIEEQARWFFNRTLRSELDRRFKEEWSDDRVLLEAVGERWVLSQGCHSCHEIPGLEDAQPIGTELTNWGSKTVDKLDFGFMPEILAEKNDWSYHQKTEFKQYRENFLEQKLHAPRSFDRRKVKNPSERLKMPWFDFTDDQVSALSTFVVGLVDDEVQRARMVPTAAETSMNEGLRVIRNKNCASCHVIEPGTIEFLDEDGHQRKVKGRFVTLEDELTPPPMKDFHEYVAGYVDYIREEYQDDEFELEEVYVELLEAEPGIGGVGSTFPITDVESIEATPAWGGDMVDLVAEHYIYSEDVEDVDGVRRYYGDEDYVKLRWTFAPPVLTDEGAKLQREWFYRFLLDPVTLRAQIRTRMPSFHWDEGEAGAVVDYFAQKAHEDWPRRYARRLLLDEDKTPQEAADEMHSLGLDVASSAQIEGVVEGNSLDVTTSLDALVAYGNALGFSMDERVDPSYETVHYRQPQVREEALAETPDLYDKVLDLVVNGPNCVQCHAIPGREQTNDTPLGWGPDLTLTRERLRPEWVREFLTDPNRIYPGTTMPQNFALDQEQWQEFLALPARQQIEAVLLWLFNMDRAFVRN